MPGPLVLREQGAFFVHGRSEVSEHSSGSPIPIFDLDLGAPGALVVDQMYVEYQVPAEMRAGAVPVVLVHGGGHTGMCWKTTPDGREGWDTLLVRHGFPVFVVDQVTRGRSGFDATGINRARATGNGSEVPNIFQFSLETAWSVFRRGPRPGDFYPDSQFPVDALEQYRAQLVPDFNFGIPTRS